MPVCLIKSLKSFIILFFIINVFTSLFFELFKMELYEVGEPLCVLNFENKKAVIFVLNCKEKNMIDIVE